MGGSSCLTEMEKAQCRLKASETVAALEEELSSQTNPQFPKSWIRGEEQHDNNNNDDTVLRSHTCQFFDSTGFYHASAFASLEECAAMKQQMKGLVNDWNPDEKALDSFGTDTEQNTARGDYFLESSDQIHFFTEPTALDKDGTSLLPEYQVDSKKMTALNKVGHALHLTPGAFSDYCLSKKVRDLVLDLGWRDPVVPQSMYIFKQALTGGVVNSHQDSTFLFTTPKQSCLGLWLALDDATLDNGCLWVRPKSHREAARRQFKRNPAHFGSNAIESRSNNAGGDASQPKLVMDDLYEHEDIIWDGSLPEHGWKGLLEAGFVPVECKAGDLVVFGGELDHLSLPNGSDHPRHTFQLHLVEGPGASVTWSPSNWLQYPDGRPFLRLLKDE
jgi:phytanoyl-CoA hydroxylase